ncbi:hypothetical protein FIBSPDRAFT_903614 [Athelia psychrophila]|uniref:Uncharacterized protein n=1 Tax=Athelia psychrophila TaxID=1759441 RepID=A0A167VRM5_9AGAM|nr:hypothetical protein FIBSPDRAFT_903614 [Fibularhizoctonia sp. CBS 109695]
MESTKTSQREYPESATVWTANVFTITDLAYRSKHGKPVKKTKRERHKPKEHKTQQEKSHREEGRQTVYPGRERTWYNLAGVMRKRSRAASNPSSFMEQPALFRQAVLTSPIGVVALRSRQKRRRSCRGVVWSATGYATMDAGGPACWTTL